MLEKKLGRTIILAFGTLMLIVLVNAVSADDCIKFEEDDGVFYVVSSCSFPTSGKYCWVSDESSCDCKRKTRTCAWTRLEAGDKSVISGPGTDEQRQAIWKWCPFDKFMSGECEIEDPSSGY